ARPPIPAARTPGFRATRRRDSPRIHEICRPFSVKTPSFGYRGKTWRLDVLTCHRAHPPAQPHIPRFVPIRLVRSKLPKFLYIHDTWATWILATRSRPPDVKMRASTVSTFQLFTLCLYRRT